MVEMKKNNQKFANYFRGILKQERENKTTWKATLRGLIDLNLSEDSKEPCEHSILSTVWEGFSSLCEVHQAS